MNGDKWSLHIGDCTNVIAAEGIKADLIVTSPPYGDVRDYGGHTFDIDAIMRACAGALVEGGVLCWNVASTHDKESGGHTTEPFRQVLEFERLGLTLWECLIWHKKQQGILLKTKYFHSHEYIWVLSKGRPKFTNPLCDRPNAYVGTKTNRGRGRTKDGIRPVVHKNSMRVGELGRRWSVWEIMTGKGHMHPIAHEHPAPYPDRLARDLIASYSVEGDTVLDPMSGSGTTIRAAVDLGREAIGVEIHDGYRPIIEKRMAQQALDLVS